MTDSYISSRVDAFSSTNSYGNGNGNGSSPALHQNNSVTSPVIRKKLMGYVGFANLPNQVHRKSVRKGFQFTAMVVGTSPLHQSQFVPNAHSGNLPPQASLVSGSPLSSTPFSTLPFTRPSNLYLLRLSVPKPSPLRASERVRRPKLLPRKIILTFEFIDIEENGVRLHLTVVDTPGFGDFVNNDDRYEIFRSAKNLPNT
jgi:septin 7